MENVNVMEERRTNVEDRRSSEDRRAAVPGKMMLEAIAGGSFVEMAGGIGAVVLTILGLAGIMPVLLTAIATISIGAAVLVKGITVSAEYFKIAREIGGNRIEAAEFSGGLSGEILAGIASTVLGILSLLGVNPMVLLPIAAIVLGAGLVFGSGANTGLNDLWIGQPRNPTYQKVLNEVVRASIGSQILTGLGVAILGILALIGMAPVILTLIAMLSLGTMVLLSESSLGVKMLSMLHGTA